MDKFLNSPGWSSPATLVLLLGTVGAIGKLLLGKPLDMTYLAQVIAIAGVLMFLVSRGRESEAWIIFVIPILLSILLAVIAFCRGRLNDAKFKWQGEMITGLHVTMLMGAMLMVSLGYW